MVSNRRLWLKQIGLGVASIGLTNFLYFSLTNYKKDFFEQLKTNNIMGIKIYEEQGKWTRITVGTMQEMQKFIGAIV